MGGGNVPTGAISDPPSLIPGVGQGFRRRNRLWRSTGFPGPADFPARDPRTVYMASRLVEAARELAIGIVFELCGDDRALPREEQELVILPQRAGFILREQRDSDMLRSERYAGFVAVDRAAHGLEHDRLLAEQIGDEPIGRAHD